MFSSIRIVSALVLIVAVSSVIASAATREMDKAAPSRSAVAAIVQETTPSRQVEAVSAKSTISSKPYRLLNENTECQL